MTGTLASRLVETHSATLLMVGDRVYKWKKPVDLGFVDFRDLPARQQACRAEVELNRRLAPDVYLGVDTLVREDGTVREPVVVMRRLPDDTRLATLVAAGRHDADQSLHLLARLLADFHSRCAPSPDPDAVAGPARLRELWGIGLDALAAAVPDVLDGADVAEARALVHDYLTGREPLLHERIGRGMVRDGHGDLLADDIFCLPDGPRVLDCLDFDASLRHGDVLCDIATLAMDLEHLGDLTAARRLVRDYVEFSGEQHPVSLEHLYIAYRAQVRAKVALIRAAQTPDQAIRAGQQEQARQLTALMLRHLRRTPAVLVLVGGLPGSGKTTVAQGLSKRAGCLVHSSDLVRRELQIPLAERYTDSNVQRVYDVLLGRARAGLQQGWTVVLDASWTCADRRAQAEQLAQQTGSPLLQLDCQASAPVADRRLEARDADDPSDADPALRRRMQASAAPWPQATAIDTGGPPELAVAAAAAALEQVGRRARDRCVEGTAGSR